jgi:4-diphosphocytidyl-2-C-methyl-D-erythritol kinase
MNLVERVTFQTPAKINFFLFIQNKRKDGYHNLFMDLVPVSLFDQIELTANDNQGFKLVSDLNNLSQEDNLVTKAVRLLERSCRKQFSLQLTLTKNIPTGAGLGGGSGNAAGVLVVFNRIFNLGFSPDQLKSMAFKLGADIPFFIEPRPVHARGCGELLTPLESIGHLPLLLYYPSFSISTTVAYSQCQSSQRQTGFWDYRLDNVSRNHLFLNDFWKDLSLKYPKLETGVALLKDSGAVVVGMSGSGSTLYGVYRSIRERNQALQKLKSATRSLYAVETLNRYAYPEEKI